MSKEKKEFTMPSSDFDKKRIADAINEVVAQMQMIDDRRSHIKDIKDMLHDTFGMPKKVVADLAKARFKDAFEDMAAEGETFQDAYKALFGVEDNSEVE